ncbi:hypothetical protein BJ170DRAFT_685499 [Xylariales sp. AK1849]|nr:hypothetical protein BJ170DRAFT_685499 [Xylariales sp. AK1849]
MSSMDDRSRLTFPVLGSAVLVFGVACSIYFVYLHLLPTPLLGIPYNEDASKHILGDLVDVLAPNGVGKPSKEWIMPLSRKHNSPVVQLFFGPFSPGVVVLSDYRETRDIMLRRDKEFGKGRLNNDGWQDVIKEFRHGMETHNPRFKEATALTRDLLSPNFLNTERAIKFIDLWDLKVQIAGELPFTAKNDLNILTFDIITAVVIRPG